MIDVGKLYGNCTVNCTVHVNIEQTVLKQILVQCPVHVNHWPRVFMYVFILIAVRYVSIVVHHGLKPVSGMNVIIKQGL